MDYLVEDTEEQMRIQRRKARMEQMRREKRLQEKRRRRMKLLMKKAAVGAAAVLVLTGIFVVFKKNTGKEETLQAENLLQNSEGEVEASEDINKEADSTTDAGQTQGTALGNLQDTKLYHFETTSDTVTVYDDEIASESLVLIDADSQKIVASKEAKKRISPASMTKVLTVLVAAENMTEEQLEDTFVMTREITDYGYVNDCSSVGFLDGESVKVKDLFYGTILPSGCDAAVGLATYVAGSHEAFVDMMNEKLEKLGISGTTHFTNCVGLYDKEHYSTVYDMAVIMKAAVENEFCKKVLSEHHYITTPTTEHPEGIDISNWFLRRIEDKDTGGEVLCAKTGYVTQSKNCAVSYAKDENGKNYICVTAGSSSNWKCIYDQVKLYKSYVPEKEV